MSKFKQVETLNLVPVEPFKKAFEDMQERGLISASEIARRLGWLRHDQRENQPDSSRVLRTLGLKGQQSGRKKYGVQVRTRISYAMGVSLAEAMGLDPVDVGV